MKPRKKHSPGSRKPGAGPPAGSERRRRRLAWCAVLLVAASAAVGFGLSHWVNSRVHSRLPVIATNGLSASSTALLRRYAGQVETSPASGKAWGQYGGLLKSFELLPEARICLAEAERLEPNESRWPYLAGLTWMVESSPRAIREFRQAVQRGGAAQPDILRLRLAKLLAETGGWDEAEQVLQPLVSAEPGYGPALLLLAQAARARGHPAEAVSLATRSATDPRSTRGAWSLLAAVHQVLGDVEAARQAAARAAAAPPDPIAVDPYDAEILALRGDPRQLSDRVQQLLAARRLSEARPIIQELIRDHPEFAEGWLLLGRQQLLEGQPDAALVSMRRHLQMEPDSANGFFQLGMAQLNARRYAEAAGCFEEALQRKRDFGPACFNLGFALGKAGRKNEAIAAFREAIRQSPEHIDSYLLVADLLWQGGRRDEALAAFGQAEALNPADGRLPALQAKLARDPPNAP